MVGGMTLIPTMKQGLASPTDVIDLGELVSREISIEDGHVRIGAGAKHADVAGHGELIATIPALCGLASGIGDPHVRNRGTLGGSIANADPAADYPAALLALEAMVTTSSRIFNGFRVFRRSF